MKKGKYSLTVSSDSLEILKYFHSFMVNDGDQTIMIPDDKDNPYYIDVYWDIKNKKNLDLKIDCRFDCPVHP